MTAPTTTASAVFGVSAIGWSAVGAISTAALTILTFGTLVVILWQVLQSRQIHLEESAERADVGLSSYRSNMMELIAKSRRRMNFSWEEMRQVRDISAHFEGHTSLILFIAKAAGVKKMVSAIARFFKDLEMFSGLLSYVVRQNRMKTDAMRSEAEKVVSDYLDEIGASDGDRAEAIRLFHVRDGSDDFQKFMKTIRIKSMSQKGMSARQIEEVFAREAAEALKGDEKENRVYNVMMSRGGDVEVFLQAEVWATESLEMLERVRKALSNLQEALTGKPPTEEVHA